MKQLFLTSSVDFVAHDIAKKLDLSTHNKLVYITTAAEPEEGDKTWLEDDKLSLIKAGFAATEYTITDKTPDQLAEDLKNFDYIYLSGGNTLYLLKKSQESGFISLIQDLVNNQGKIYIGTSAGSIIAGSKCPDYLLKENETMETNTMAGYGFVNFTIMPHWGSDYFKERYLNKRIAVAYKKDQVPLILLTDTQYVHVKDDTFEIIDVTK